MGFVQVENLLFTSDTDIESWLKFLNKEGLFDFAMVVCFAIRQNIKGIPLDA